MRAGVCEFDLYHIYIYLLAKFECFILLLKRNKNQTNSGLPKYFR